MTDALDPAATAVMLRAVAEHVLASISARLRERFLSHRLWASYDDILDACCTAWNALLGETGRIRSLCALDWATTVNS